MPITSGSPPQRSGSATRSTGTPSSCCPTAKPPSHSTCRTVRRRTALQPRPIRWMAGSTGDLLERSPSHSVWLPEKWVKGSLHLQLAAYPAPTAEMAPKLEALFKDATNRADALTTSKADDKKAPDDPGSKVKGEGRS